MHLFINNDVVSTFLGNNPVINKMHGVSPRPPAPQSLGLRVRPARGSLRLNILQGHHCSFPSSVWKVDGLEVQQMVNSWKRA